MFTVQTAEPTTECFCRSIAPGRPPSELRYTLLRALRKAKRFRNVIPPVHELVYGAYCPYCGAGNRAYAEYFRCLDNLCSNTKRTHGSWITQRVNAGYAQIAGDTYLVGINEVACDSCSDDKKCKAVVRELITYRCDKCEEEFRCEVPNHEQTARKELLKSEEEATAAE